MTFKSFIPESINWIIGTSYRIGEKEFRVVWNDYQELGMLKYCRKAYSQHQGDMYIRTPWNALILVVSADNQDSLLGEGLSHAILCESARHDRSIWEQQIGSGYETESTQSDPCAKIVNRKSAIANRKSKM